MTVKTILLIVLLAVCSAACSKNAAAPGISKFSIGRNAAGEPPVSTFNTGESMYAVASANTPGKYNMDFRVSAEDNVINKAKGEPVMNKASDFEGTQPQRLNFQIAFPGTYKVEALLTDAAGNRIDSKSEIITVIGEPPSGDGDRDREDRDRNADRDKASEPEREHEQERDKPQK